MFAESNSKEKRDVATAMSITGAVLPSGIKHPIGSLFYPILQFKANSDSTKFDLPLSMSRFLDLFTVQIAEVESHRDSSISFDLLKALEMQLGEFSQDVTVLYQVLSYSGVKVCLAIALFFFFSFF